MEEEENLRKKDTHYGDVLFDEARTHGAGFYKFSRNESDRHTERENLDSIHKETLKVRSKIDNEKSEADAKMAIRLRKIKNKKRKKMGLPPLPSEGNILISRHFFILKKTVICIRTVGQKI